MFVRATFPRLKCIGVTLFAVASLVHPVSSSRASAGQQSRSVRAAPRPVSAFSPQEWQALKSGESVSRKFTIQKDSVDHHAGLSYRLVKAKPMDVIRALRRPDGIVRSIPYCLEATTLSEEDGVSEVRILQGKRPFTGGYTVRLEWDLSEYTARFWMDPGHDHDVRDIWGRFSAREVSPGWTLVSFGFAFDIGGVGELLEGKAQEWGLSTADRIAQLVEGSPAVR